MKEIQTKIVTAFLIELISSANANTPLHRQYGIPDDIFKEITTMSGFEIDELAKAPFFSIEINSNYLRRSLQQVLDIRDKKSVIETAIRMGASRAIMKKYGSIPPREFATKRAELNIDGIRNRPKNLDSYEYEQLSISHNKYGKSNPIRIKFDHLRTLVYLSENSNIDINRIYQYFYDENQHMYMEVYNVSS